MQSREVSTALGIVPRQSMSIQCLETLLSKYRYMELFVINLSKYKIFIYLFIDLLIFYLFET